MSRKVAISPDLVEGDADQGYGKVADAFRANFAAHRDIGAAVAVYRDGVKVVDMWGGYRNGFTKTRWQHDTMVNMFSTTKGIASLAVSVAASRGLISYDAKVADYWPAFAQAGKAEVTVRQLLSHQAGLSALDAPLLLADLTNQETLSAALAAQAPAWPHALGNLLVLVVAFFNLLIHTRDAWTSVVPIGLSLSIITALILPVTGWLGWSMVYRHGVGVAR